MKRPCKVESNEKRENNANDGDDRGLDRSRNVSDIYAYSGTFMKHMHRVS